MTFVPMIRRGGPLAVLILSLAGLSACGGGGVGDPCSSVGSSDECANMTVCTDEPGGDVCREVCMEDTDCASDYFCDSVPGSSEDTCQIRR